jgi:hypothetical protein
MRVLKPLLIILAIIVVVAAAALFYILQNLDDIVQDAVEDVGSDLTGTTVALDGVDIDLGSGRATLRGLEIDNPPGYASDYAFAVDTVTVDLQPSSVTGAVILIDEIAVAGARLNAEQRGAASNVSDILRNVERSAGRESAPAEPGEPLAVRLALGRFAFTGTEATLSTEKYGAASLRVPDVVRRDIGDPEVGLAPEELAREILEAVLEETQDAVADHLADLAKDAAREAAKDKLKEKLDLSDEDMDKAEGVLKGLFERD